MNLTLEQQKILNDVINGKENVVISAFAGTGKTTLLEQIIKEPKLSKKKKLYLVFNKKNANEAKERFSKYKNVDIYTTHALAYKFIINHLNLNRPINYNIVSFKSYFNVDFEKAKYIYQHFKNWVISDKNLKDYFFKKNGEPKSEYHEYYYNNIMKLILDVLQCNYSCSHDLYLKLFEIMLKKTDEISNYLTDTFSNIYDIILIDEAQDTNEVTLSIFDNIKATQKIVVGDVHQQIYSFRGSVNALSKLKKDENDIYYLTQSFRYTNKIAKNATNYLKIFKGEKNEIKGIDEPKLNGTKCVITRTNAKIIEFILEAREKGIIVKTVKDVNEIFELPLNIYYFKMNQLNKITKSFNYYVKEFKTYENLLKKHNIIEDISLSNAIELIERINSKLFVAKKYIENCNKINTDDFYYISNAHISKGLEFDEVIVADDFGFLYSFVKIAIDELFLNVDFNEILIDNLFELDANLIKMIIIKLNNKLNDIITNLNLNNVSNQNLIDELNLFYVAITRAKKKLKFENKNMKLFIRDAEEVKLLLYNIFEIALSNSKNFANEIKEKLATERLKKLPEITQENIIIVFANLIEDFKEIFRQSMLYALSYVDLDILNEITFERAFNEYFINKIIQ